MNNSITAPKGFLAAGLASGVKVSGKHDLGLLVCPTGATAAAMFTTNKITSAAVQVSREHHREPEDLRRRGQLRQRQRLHREARAWPMPARCATPRPRHSRREPQEVLVASTGIIGAPVAHGQGDGGDRPGRPAALGLARGRTGLRARDHDHRHQVQDRRTARSSCRGRRSSDRRHGQGRRHDRAQHGDHPAVHHDRRRDRQAAAGQGPQGGDRRLAQPAHRRRPPEHQRHRDPPGLRHGRQRADYRTFGEPTASSWRP